MAYSGQRHISTNSVGRKFIFSCSHFPNFSCIIKLPPRLVIDHRMSSPSSHVIDPSRPLMTQGRPPCTALARRLLVLGPPYTSLARRRHVHNHTCTTLSLHRLVLDPPCVVLARSLIHRRTPLARHLPKCNFIF